MAYNYYSKEKLVKVGMEGFAMLHECLGRKGARVNAPQRPPPTPPQGPQVVTPISYRTKDNVSAMDCYEAATICGGTLVVDYPKRKPMRVA